MVKFKRIKKGIVTLAALVSFLGCSVGVKAPSTNLETVTKDKWKVSAYLDGDSNLDLVCFWNLNQMEKVGSNDNVTILAQLDRFDEVDPFFKTKRYHVKKDEDIWNINSYIVKDFDKEVNMGSMEEFESFIKWSKHFSDSKRQLLIIKGHGFGIMQPLGKLLYGKAWSLTEGNINHPLSVYDVDYVLKKNLDRKLDMLVFDSCNMASIEVAYQLRDYAETMIASEDTIGYFSIYDSSMSEWKVLIPGIEYEKVLNFLTENPYTKNETLGNFIIDSFYEQFKSSHYVNGKKISLDTERATLSAIRLKNLDSFVGKFENFSKGLIARLEDVRTKEQTFGTLQKVLKEVQRYSEPYSSATYTYVDLFDFLNKFYKYTCDNELKEQIQRLKKSDIIISSIYHHNQVKGSNGISILFIENPHEWGYLCRDGGECLEEITSKIKDYYSRSDFAKKTGWDRVMEIYQQCSK